MKCKIAVVQFEITQFAVEKNLAKAETFIKQAAAEKADIIVFPEDFVTGPIEHKKELADADHVYRNHFQRLAKEYKIDIIPGSFIEKDDAGLFNTTYYIDSTGEVLARYRKVNLWLSERGHFIPGHEMPVVQTKFGKIGLTICWDLMFPEIFRKMVDQGVELVFCPAYWCFKDAGEGLKYDKNSEIKLVDALCVGRAFENEIALVFCNAAGEFTQGNFSDAVIGHSQITVPFKGAIKKFTHNTEGMFVKTVDTAILKVAEESYKVRHDLKNKG
ncbi:MAG: carbon-nitrogen hydrolase family protein [Patescibacteria group bacterium]|jgi:predicted amidohydrolase